MQARFIVDMIERRLTLEIGGDLLKAIRSVGRTMRKAIFVVAELLLAGCAANQVTGNEVRVVVMHSVDLTALSSS
jgi:uncharacterized lipoprotein YajG